MVVEKLGGSFLKFSVCSEEITNCESQSRKK
jgi:hypothetical protein